MNPQTNAIMDKITAGVFCLIGAIVPVVLIVGIFTIDGEAAKIQARADHVQVAGQ